jgi:hypothetical protein
VETADVARLPDPTQAASWEAFTRALRELHLACGRPTYEALSARTGLPKSAISYLIGRNPVRQPSMATVLRFVEGCLGYAGCAPAAVELETNRWRQTHQRLDDVSADRTPLEAPPGPAAPPASPTGRDAGPAPRSRTLLVVVAATCLAALVTAVAVGVTHAQDAPGTTATVPAPVPSASATDVATAPPTGQQCVERAEPQDDARLGRSWPTVFYCPNRPSRVYTWAHDDGRPISDLESRSSWFVCWTEGQTSTGAPEIFYYTQGDTTSRRPELDAWGYVPAKAVVGAPTPAPGLTRRCPFPTSPTTG